MILHDNELQNVPHDQSWSPISFFTITSHCEILLLLFTSDIIQPTYSVYANHQLWKVNPVFIKNDRVD